jgi:hypothetical protein
MSGRSTARLEGSVLVSLPPREAFELFTPSGERRWAAGWDPSFPASPVDETAPGTVFQTSHGHRATWVVVDCEPGQSISYANVVFDERASVVRVHFNPGNDHSTIAQVSYFVTALSEEGDAAVDLFASRYQSFLAGWETAIAAAIRG